MRHYITVTFRIGINEAGEVEVSRPTVEGGQEVGGLTAVLTTMLNAAKPAVVTTPAPSQPPLTSAAAPARAKSEGSLGKARHYADQLGIPQHELDAALAGYAAERVAEVLEWIRAKARREPVRSATGLLWSVLGRGG